MSRRSAAAGMCYYEEAAQDGDRGWDSWLERCERDRADVAHFIGSHPERTSFLQNCSLGLNIVARSFPTGSEVLALDKEFPSCTTPWIRAGHRVRFMGSDEAGRIDAAAVQRAITDSTAALVLSSVQFANGFRADVRSIGLACRSAGVRLVVDATQSICAFPLDMEADAIDYLVFSGYKWACAGYGNAVLAVSADAAEGSVPPLTGWRSARRAYDLENDRLDLLPAGIGHEMGHPSIPGIFTLAEAIREWSEVDQSLTSARIRSLTNRLRAGLEQQGAFLVSAAETDRISGITLLRTPRPADVAAWLKRRGILTSARKGGLRVSLHAYNTEEDVDAFLAAWRERPMEGR